MGYGFYAPSKLLSPYVHCFWTHDYDGSNDSSKYFNTVVDGSSGIVFQHHNGSSCFVNERHGKVDTGLIYGKQLVPSKSLSIGPSSATGVNFTAQGIKLLFGVDAWELTGRQVSLDDFTCVKIVEQLMDLRTHRQKIELLSNFILRKIDSNRRDDKLITDCCQRIKFNKGNLKVSQLLKYYGVSERQLERRFKQTVGLPPKLFMRITKFQYAMQAITSGRATSLLDIAIELNYPDQSRLSII